MGLRSWVKKKAKQAKKKAEQAKRKVERTVQKGADKAERAAKDTRESFENLGKQTVSTAEKAWEWTEDYAAKEAEKVVEKIFNDAKKDIEDFAKDAVRTVEREVIDQVEKAGAKAVKEVEQTVTEKLPDLAEKALQEAMDGLQSAVAKEGLKLLRDGSRAAHHELDSLRKSKPGLADAIDTLGYSLKLGPMTLSYSGFYGRAQDLSSALDSYVNDPPKFRRKPLIELITALGPDSVDLGIDVSAAFLVVQSDSLSVGFNLDTIPLELFVEIADAILEAIGVPE